MHVLRGLCRQALLCFTALALGGIASAAGAPATTLYGAAKPLGKGSVRSLVVLDGSGRPSALGILVSKDALKDLPAGPEPTEVELALPEGGPVPPFTHLTLDWNPAGHEPPGIYDVPHFDFHFYMIPSQVRTAIRAEDVGPFAKAPAPQYLPVDYRPAPGGVPRMGAHWIDVTSPEFHGERFTTTFIYGTYDGSVVFYEPMVTLAFLESGKPFRAPIKQSAASERTGYRPGAYKVEYSEPEGGYRVLLEDLVP